MKNRWLALSKGEGRLTRVLASACACRAVIACESVMAVCSIAGDPEDELRRDLARVAAARAADDVPAELSSALKKRQLIAIECVAAHLCLPPPPLPSVTPFTGRRRRTTYYRLVRGSKFKTVRTKAAAELTREMLDRRAWLPPAR